MSLNDNMPLISALTNDDGWDEVYVSSPESPVGTVGASVARYTTSASTATQRSSSARCVPFTDAPSPQRARAVGTGRPARIPALKSALGRSAWAFCEMALRRRSSAKGRLVSMVPRL